MRKLLLLGCLFTVQPAGAQQSYPNIDGETLLEDDRVVVQMFRLEPGQWEGIHEHPEHQLVIVLNSTDELVYRYRGSKRTFQRPADEGPDEVRAFWRPGPVLMSDQHESGNTGSRTLEWIAITFKSDSIALDEPLEQFVTPTTADEETEEMN